MPCSASRLTLLLLAVPFVSACAVGSEDGPGSFTSALTVGPGGETGDAATESDDASTEGPGTAGSADGTTGGPDLGNPLCCQPGAQAGCGSELTESCVCTAQTSCCEAVWGPECVDLAIACGDPYCTDGSGSSSGDAEADTGSMLECDDAFTFMPANPAPGVEVNVTFTDPIGLTYVGMRAEGPGGVMLIGGDEVISGMGPFFWSYDFNGLAAGVWTFSFTHRESADGPDLVRGTCQKQI